MLKVKFVDIKNVFLLNGKNEKLIPEMHKGKLVYRVRGTSKRISYSTLVKKNANTLTQTHAEQHRPSSIP